MVAILILDKNDAAKNWHADKREIDARQRLPKGTRSFYHNARKRVMMNDKVFSCAM